MMISLIKHVILLLLTFVSLDSLASVKNQVTISSTDRIEIRDAFEYCAAEKDASFQDILRHGNFESKAPPGGIYDEAIWTKVTIKNSSRSKNFTIEYPLIIGVFESYFMADGEEHVTTTGIFSNPGLQSHHSNVIPISLEYGETKEVYFKFYYEDPINFNVTIQDTDSFLKSDRQSTALYFAFFGSILTLMIFSLIQFAIFKDPMYAYYFLALLFTNILGIGLVFGFVTAYLIPSDVFFRYNLGNVFGLLQVGFNTLFIKTLLKKQKIGPIINILLSSQMALAFVLVAPIVYFDQNMYTSYLVNFLLSAVNIVILIAAVVSYLRGKPDSRFAFVGWSGLMAGSYTLTLWLHGSIEDNILTRYAVFAGAIFEGYTMAIGLAVRQFRVARENTARRQKEKTQVKTIENLVHNIREPLKAGKATLTVLRKVTGQKSISGIDLDQAIADINRQVLSVDDKVRNILLKKNGIKEDLKPISAAESVLQVSKRYTFLSKHTIGLDICFNHRSKILADKGSLDLVLENLLTNAITMMEKNCQKYGHLVSFTTREHSDLITISIRNTNTYISKKDREKIFKRGYTTNRGGFGIGLDIAQNKAMSMGGKIFVDSCEENGTVFWIEMKSARIIDDESVCSGAIKAHIRGKEKDNLFSIDKIMTTSSTSNA